MGGRILKRPAVLIDLEEHFVAIGRDSFDAALRFLEAAEQAFQRYAEWPLSGRA